MSIDHRATAKLASRFHGQVLDPSQPEFAAAHEIWNRLHDRRPAIVARCTDNSDIAQAVQFGREHGLEIAVRGGGHHVAGYASCEDGLLLDLSPMRGIHVDRSRQIAMAQAGCTWAILTLKRNNSDLRAPALLFL